MRFKNYLDANSTGLLAATAELGIATCLESQNKLDEAAAAYQRVISVFNDSPCVQPAEFALGRIAEQQNKLTEAVSHYESVARSGLGGSLAQEAAMRASDLKAKIAATAPKPAATAAPKSTAAPVPALLSVPSAATKP
jgi:predicted negative regulator of RcsB-dependent stress response